MLCLHPRVEVGDLVIVYEDFKTMSAVRVAPPKVFTCRFGKFPHDKMVGMRYGERMSASSSGSSGGGGGYVTLLPPSPELWTETLPHRTQILYIADISMIALQLELLPESVVIEAGTGSGSLTHALARTLSAKGHLHTFEFNATRAQLAQGEFTANQLGDRVTCRHGDVCAEGFSYEAEAALAHESVDAAIFDLPQPWDAIRLAAPYLKPGGRLCVFSPCIEQVARALDALQEGGFTGCEVIEAIVRTHEVRTVPAAPSTLEAAVAKAEEARRARDAATPAVGDGEEPPLPQQPPPPKTDVVEEDAQQQQQQEEKPPTEEEEETVAAAEGEEGAREPSAKRPRVDAPPSKPASSGPPGVRTKPSGDMRGHTGFLVFCTKHVG